METPPSGSGGVEGVMEIDAATEIQELVITLLLERRALLSALQRARKFMDAPVADLAIVDAAIKRATGDAK